MKNSFTEEQIIDLFNNYRRSANIYGELKREIEDWYFNEETPDLTDLWNFVTSMFHREQITIYESNDFKRALLDLEKEGKCILAESDEYP